MELWEGAILVVGGIWLVGYMASKNAAVQATAAAPVAGAASAASPAGVSNTSNLTTITNTAGGTPTVMGEPLEGPQPPLLGSGPPRFLGTPFGGPISKRAAIPSGTMAPMNSRPMAIHL
jgi:hypothetical protein